MSEILFSGAVIAGMIGIGLAMTRLFQPQGEILRTASVTWGHVIAGDFASLGAPEVGALLWVGALKILGPLAVLLAMVLVERLIGRRTRQAKNHVLIWGVQLTYGACAVLLAYFVGKAGFMPQKPLLSLGAGSGSWTNPALVIPAYVLTLFLSDLLRYWLHRAQHAVPLLWRFHAVHHSPSDLDVLHNVTHPLEFLCSVIVIGIPVAFLIGFDHGAIYWVAGAVAVQTHFIHMNSPVHLGRFGKVILDNRHHFLHHSRDPADFNRNFAGTFPVLDMLFGTYKAPGDGSLPLTGFEETRPNRLRDFIMGRGGPAGQV